MKYGDTLLHRSIPLWETYNVDYNDIKRLIKVRTTHGQGQPKAIPGSDNEAKQLQAFESELYKELREQHQRIDLFVQSKAGEITRRLDHLNRQIAQLAIRSFASGSPKLSIRRLEKFSRAEAATLKAGEEIQYLSRFVSAQSLAFQKLLKKYRKWTGSSELGKRFHQGVLDRPTSFSNKDFLPLLAKWTEVLASVRAPFENGPIGLPDSSNAKDQVRRSNGLEIKVVPDQKVSGTPSRPSSIAADLQSIWTSCSSVDMDTAFSTLPLNEGGRRAVYWVHPDNLVQIHVLLLQYTRSQRLNHSDAPPVTPSSSRSSPRGSLSINGIRPFPRTDEEIGVIVCDDIQNFAKRQNGETISDFVDRPGTAAEKASASIRYSSNGRAVVSLSPSPEPASLSAQSDSRSPPIKAKLESKQIYKMFNASEARECDPMIDSQDFSRVCKWLGEHQEVQPLVQLQARRSRFIGLKNDQTGGVWVTLDKEVLMRSYCEEIISNGKAPLPMSESASAVAKSFPYTILEVRVEGDAGNDFIAALDDSHLTESIRGFSLETHAVATLCETGRMLQPPWLAALEQDIRKVPVATESNKARAPQRRLSREQSSAGHVSIAASSTTNGPPGSSSSTVQHESSVTSAPETAASVPSSPLRKKKRRSHRKRLLQEGFRQASYSNQRRYWNEFDDGSEGSENEAYTILVDPDASYSFPGSTQVSKVMTFLRTKVLATKQKADSLLRLNQEHSNRENQPLINGTHSPSIQDSDESDEEPSPRLVKPITSRDYATFSTAPHQSPAFRVREKFLFRSCLASFGASFVLLIVATILVDTGRRKAEATVDVGIIVGAAASLVFAVIAVGNMMGRSENVGWVHRSIVILVFLCIVAISGALLASLG